jgi:uncharacterized protein
MRAVLTLSALLLAACGGAPPSASQLANPASEYCVTQGGTVEIVAEGDGEVGYCVLPDGSRVEEWELYQRDTATTDDGDDDAPDGGSSWDDARTEQARQEARNFLGMAEVELPPEVRIGRRGDEEYILTQDYVPGRVTVELDDQDGAWRVTSLEIELPEGPETFELEAS